MSVVIRQIATHQDLIQVAQLRYEVTVGEMSLEMRHANHNERTVLEPLDLSGHVFAAWLNDRMLGTVRVNLLKESDIGFYYDAYGIPLLPESVQRSLVSMTTRLAVLKPFRGGPVPMRLAMAAFNFGISNDVTHDVIDSRPGMVPFFERLGYKTHIPALNHPEFGNVVVQVLTLNDEQHLANKSSPFLKLLKAHQSARVCTVPTQCESAK